MNRKLLAAALILALALSVVPASFAVSSIGIGDAVNSNDTIYPQDNTVMTMYVVTDNGLGLNVRSEPYVSDYNILAVAPYGSRIEVLRFLDNGWAAVRWSYYGEAYVQSRFLQWYAPGPYITNPPVTPQPTAVPYIPTPVPYDPTYADTIAGLNAEFRTMRTVTPFTILVRPARSSGWVNMRWAPGKDMEVVRIYYNGDRLTVLSEGANWYLVQDPSTNAVGYMMKTYTTRLY